MNTFILKFHNGDVVEIEEETYRFYKNNCALCNWFRSASQRMKKDNWVDDEGWCVRYPPVFIGGKMDESLNCDSSRFRQPGCYGGDECGEFDEGYDLHLGESNDRT